MKQRKVSFGLTRESTCWAYSDFSGQPNGCNGLCPSLDASYRTQLAIAAGRMTASVFEKKDQLTYQVKDI
jgi:hypothetical protein